MTDLLMRVKQLEVVLDTLFNSTQDKLGIADPITKQSLQALMYLQGLKYDINSSPVIQENTYET